MTTTAKDPMAAVPSQAFARVVFVDCETNGTGTELLDFGAADTAGEVLHSTTPEAVRSFIGNARFLCGHNVFALALRRHLPGSCPADTHGLIRSRFPYFFSRKSVFTRY